ncbi:hypothetical protein LP125_200 [Listeria phage LP-125]|uniref:Uncharacterized protein n=4 Tax=Pecentumvirus TaxID=1857844 RepID=W0G8J6_9CAUD|nr:hypothetical protein QLX35_gp027 [Listeria phage LP-125]YP_009044479.1 hypothetical protein LP083-2_022 [Listeria phage LP-083-2]YP_009592556.1 hypothetical protein FDG78_gp027 [Listeria phage LP-064]YP_009784644.1 hypothetical protein QLX40_gp132 [Listeria phage LP-124]QIG60759.1 putative oxygenase protein [Listeria phage vB_Lino_VEfB7]AHF53399.1 hypothetical protein LP125_200 [Listeria phage LP-125]AHL19047.1 hypothetical protein LP064_027 [Listeria phage LP-064]AHL19230.1 hypothetical 
MLHRGLLSGHVFRELFLNFFILKVNKEWLYRGLYKNLYKKGTPLFFLR